MADGGSIAQHSLSVWAEIVREEICDHTIGQRVSDLAHGLKEGIGPVGGGLKNGLHGL